MGQVLSVFVLVIGIAEAVAFLDRFRRSYIPLLCEEHRFLRCFSPSRDLNPVPTPRSRRSLVGELVRGTAGKIWSKKPSADDAGGPAVGSVHSIPGIIAADKNLGGVHDGRRKVSLDPVIPTLAEVDEGRQEEEVVKGPSPAKPVVKSPVVRAPPLGPEFVRVGKPVHDEYVDPDLTPPPPMTPSSTPDLRPDASDGIRGDHLGATENIDEGYESIQVIESPPTGISRITPKVARMSTPEGLTNSSISSKANCVGIRPEKSLGGRAEEFGAGSLATRGSDASGDVRVAEVDAPKEKSGKEVTWADDVVDVVRGRGREWRGDNGGTGKFRDQQGHKASLPGERIPPPPRFDPPPVPPDKEDPGEVRIKFERSQRRDTEGGEAGRGPAAVEESPRKEAFWLIFSGEYTKAMSKEWHSGHFCCWQCDESLTGQRYVLRDEHPYCVRCYESVFANLCEQCNKTIGIDSKDLSYKDKHWHEACFLCTKCRVSLVDKQFGSKADKIYCGNCYDAQFASRCDGCGEIFRAGTKKMEYKTRQWHEKCFCCCVCKTAIGTKSFIPREQEIYCATCYEEKFATRCVKCNKIITTGGVTYKNEPWHRECFTCTHCSASLAGQRFTSRDEKPYCADCFGELFAKRCVACSRPITGIGGTRFISFEDRHWHNDCFICASCKTSLVGRGFITDGEDVICPECAKQKLM